MEIQKKVLVLGEAGVGKTTLIAHLCGANTDELVTPGVRIMPAEVSLNDGFDISTSGGKPRKNSGSGEKENKLKLMVSDIPGEMGLSPTQTSHFHGADGALLVFDMTSRESYEALNGYVDHLRRTAGNIPFVVVGNKADQELVVTYWETIKFAKQHGGGHAKVSAIDQDEAMEPFRILGKLMLQANLPADQQNQKDIEASFLSIPQASLESLMEMLQTMLSEENARYALLSFGHHWGQFKVDFSSMSSDLDTLEKVSMCLFRELGLSGLEFLKTEEEEIIIQVPDTSFGNKPFLEGFASGIVSGLLNKSFVTEGEVEGEHYKIHLEPGDLESLDFQLDLESDSDQSGKKTGDSQKYGMDFASTYLFPDVDNVRAFGIFTDQFKQGNPALCITRQFPKNVQKHYGLEESQIFWLTDGTSATTEVKVLDAKRLDFELSRTLHKFLDGNDQGVILLDGVEYLISHNGFDKVVKFLQVLRDKVVVRNGMLLCPVDPRSFEEIQFQKLKKAFNTVLDEVEVEAKKLFEFFGAR